MRLLATRSLLAVWAGLLITTGSAPLARGAPSSPSVLTVEYSHAVPLNSALRSRFGLGVMPSLSAAVPAGKRLFLGMRLRFGALMDGPAPKDPTLKDPGWGGLATLLVMGRFAFAQPARGYPTQGPYLEAALGSGLTGSLMRWMAEGGLGWGFKIGRTTLGPTLRYLHIVEPAGSLNSSDGMILLAGVEWAFALAGKRPSESPRVAGEKSVAGDGVLGTDEDGDQDGVPNRADGCPNEREDKDGFEDGDGCPDPDNDKDGFLDAVDACPREAETVNGIDDGDGCPDVGVIEVKEERLSYEERVFFDVNRARIRPEVVPILEAIVTLWQQHPEWDRLVIEGHADKRGPEDYNNWLSQERAERTRVALIELGFPADKIEVAGYGKRLPLKEGDSEGALQENRRVEFVIVRKAGVKEKSSEALAPGAVEGKKP